MEAGTSGALFHLSRIEAFRIDPESRGSFGSSGDTSRVNMAIGTAKGRRANAFAGAEVGSFFEKAHRHGIYFGARAPALSGPGVFVNPLGIVNGASFAMQPFPIAPGSIVALFGTNLAPTGTDARPQEPARSPSALAGVSVLVNGTPAALYSVTPVQVDFQLPFTVKESSVRIAVNNNGTLSNPVEGNVAATSPGVFTADGRYRAG